MPDHGCRIEPHCECGHNAWYHGDGEDDSVEENRCYMDGCTCEQWKRCPLRGA